MANVPRYEGGSEVQVGPMADMSSIYQSYSNMFDTISKQVKPFLEGPYNKSLMTAAEQSAEAGNFKPLPEVTESAKLYNQAGLAANKIVSTADISNAVTNFKQAALVNVSQNSLNNFSSNMKSYTQGFMKNVPDDQRLYFKALLSTQATQAHAQIQNELLKKQNRNAEFELYDSNAKTMQSIYDRMASQDPVLRNTAFTLLENQHQQIQKLVDAGVMTPISAETLISSNKKDATDYYHLSSFNHILNSGLPDANENAMKYMEQVRNDNGALSILGQSGVNSLLNQMHQSLMNHTSGVNVSAQEHNLLKNKIEDLYMNNQKPNTQDLQDYFNYEMAHTKGFNPKFESERLSTISEIGSELSLSKSINLGQEGSYLDSIRNKINKLNSNDDQYETKKKYYTKLLTDAKDIFNTRRNDRALSVKLYDPGYNQYVQNMKIDPKNYTKDGLLEFIKNSELSQGTKPSDVTYLTKDESTSWINQFKSGNDSDRFNMINAVTSFYKEKSGSVFRQLSKNENSNINLGTIYTAMINPETMANAQDLLHSQILPENYFDTSSLSLLNRHYSLSKISNDLRYNKQADGGMNEFINTMHEQGQGLTDLQGKKTSADNLIDSASKYAFLLIKEYNMSPSQAEKQAADTVLNAHLISSSFNGGSYYIQKRDYEGKVNNPLLIKAGLMYQANKAVSGKDLDLPKGMDKLTYQQAIQNTLTIRNNGNSGYFLNTNGLKIPFKNHGPIITNEELNDPNSPFMKEALEAIKKQKGGISDNKLQEYIDDGIQDIPYVINSKHLREMRAQLGINEYSDIPESELEKIGLLSFSKERGIGAINPKEGLYETIKKRGKELIEMSNFPETKK